MNNMRVYIPETLRLLADMILNGRAISNETEKEGSSSEMLTSLTQLIVFNALKRKRKDTTYHRNVSECETKLPLYLGLLIHGKTRKRELVDILHDRGLCISYDRVMQISTDIANSVITQFEESHVVCLSFFKSNVFTTGNLDNIDHNPSSNTSRDAQSSQPLTPVWCRIIKDKLKLGWTGLYIYAYSTCILRSDT